jgi:hypothetical protein
MIRHCDVVPHRGRHGGDDAPTVVDDGYADSLTGAQGNDFFLFAAGEDYVTA